MNFAPNPGFLVLIERAALLRDCIARSLSAALNQPVASYDSVASFAQTDSTRSVGVVILSRVGCPLRAEADAELDALFALARANANLVLAAADDVDDMMKALDRGVQGYVSVTTPLAVIVETIRLVHAGGVYYPAAPLMAAGRSAAVEKKASPPEIFTARQAAVIEALRRGKANKIIAYELNMCESTVKVHVRNIMKKLKARNRTEVAVRANEMKLVE
jgi:DNA-binding NarL/FixJ family response regulator